MAGIAAFILNEESKQFVREWEVPVPHLRVPTDSAGCLFPLDLTRDQDVSWTRLKVV
jgi:hypothetical protein